VAHQYSLLGRIVSRRFTALRAHHLNFSMRRRTLVPPASQIGPAGCAARLAPIQDWLRKSRSARLARDGWWIASKTSNALGTHIASPPPSTRARQSAPRDEVRDTRPRFSWEPDSRGCFPSKICLAPKLAGSQSVGHQDPPPHDGLSETGFPGTAHPGAPAVWSFGPLMHSSRHALFFTPLMQFFAAKSRHYRAEWATTRGPGLELMPAPPI